MRRAARTDDNQSRIVRALEQVGCIVQSLAAVGVGCPDLLVGYHGRNYLFEIKNPKHPPSARKLTPAQQTWHARWRGDVAIVLTPTEALAHLVARMDPLKP